MGLPAVQTIDHPRPSLGSTKVAPRSSIQIHLRPNNILLLQMEIILRWLHTQLQSFQGIVGTLDTMSHADTLLMDTMSTEAGHLLGDLSWSSIVLSPRLIAVQTRTDASTWNNRLTAMWNQDPATAGIKLRSRPSKQSRQAFAQVEATASDIASVRARKGQTGHNPSLRDPPTLQATITTPLSTCGPLEQWLPAFMQKVATDNNLPLQSSTAESGLDTYKWRPIMAYDGSWTGKVVVQLTTPAEVHQLFHSIHGRGIEVQHHLAGITVESTYLDLGAGSNQRDATPTSA